MTCPHSEKPCFSRHDCERCPVMQAFGWFIVWKRDKATWEQRFILEKDRVALAAECDARIRQAEADRVKILAIPTREEYERSTERPA